MILAWLIIVPLLAGIAAWAAARLHARAPALISLAALTLELALAFPLRHAGAETWIATYDARWIPAFGMDVRLGLDG